jgi:uncharacterized membrane protein
VSELNKLIDINEYNSLLYISVIGIFIAGLVGLIIGFILGYILGGL